MPKRKVRAWGFQKPGPHPFWAKVAAFLGENRETGAKPSEWQHLAKHLRIGASTLSAWKDAGQLPPPDFCVWLAARMRVPLADLLDSETPLGATKPADQAIREWIDGMPPALREAIARGVRSNPRAAVGVLAGLDPSAALPG